MTPLIALLTVKILVTLLGTALPLLALPKNTAAFPDAAMRPLSG